MYNSHDYVMPELLKEVKVVTINKKSLNILTEAMLLVFEIAAASKNNTVENTKTYEQKAKFLVERWGSRNL